MLDRANPQAIEELSLNEWPAMHTVLHDGWILRSAAGYTRRANSVSPLYPSVLPLASKVRYCEGFYREQGQVATFKLTPAALPAGLDGFLARRGYRKHGLTSVQVMDLHVVDDTAGAGVAIESSGQDGWLELYGQINGERPDRQQALAAMLDRMPWQHGFASLTLDGEAAAVGLGVVQGEHLGLLNIATAPKWRNLGFARRVVTALLAWGREQGARRAHLSVLSRNATALILYSRVGFVEQYRYWYRVKAA